MGPRTVGEEQLMRIVRRSERLRSEKRWAGECGRIAFKLATSTNDGVSGSDCMQGKGIEQSVRGIVWNRKGLQEDWYITGDDT